MGFYIIFLRFPHIFLHIQIYYFYSEMIFSSFRLKFFFRFKFQKTSFKTSFFSSISNQKNDWQKSSVNLKTLTKPFQGNNLSKENISLVQKQKQFFLHFLNCRWIKIKATLLQSCWLLILRPFLNTFEGNLPIRTGCQKVTCCLWQKTTMTYCNVKKNR